MKREELKTFYKTSCHEPTEEFYCKDDADKVMDALEYDIRIYQDIVAKAEARIKELEQVNLSGQPKWISVEDRLPQEGEEAIVFYTNWKHDYQQVAMFESGEFIDIGGCALSPTHWMPLPQPPIK